MPPIIQAKAKKLTVGGGVGALLGPVGSGVGVLVGWGVVGGDVFSGEDGGDVTFFFHPHDPPLPHLSLSFHLSLLFHPSLPQPLLPYLRPSSPEDLPDLEFHPDQLGAFHVRSSHPPLPHLDTLSVDGLPVGLPLDDLAVGALDDVGVDVMGEVVGLELVGKAACNIWAQMANLEVRY